MRRAGLAGATGRPKWRHAKPDQVAADLVDRNFARTEPNQLCVTDITEHPTREGKLYCAVVLDSCSRRVVGWSIDATPTAALVTNALGMAIQTRTPPGGTIIHSDQGVQGGFNWSSQHLHGEELRWEHGDRGRAWRAGYRCARLVGRRWRGVSIGNGSGRRSRTGCPARTPPWCVAYRRRWGRGGSGKVAACHQPVWPRCRAATCRWWSEKRSPSSRPKAVACARSVAGWGVQRRPSRARYAATPRPVAACWSIGPRPRSGTPIGVPSAPRWPSSPATTRYGGTCRTGLRQGHRARRHGGARSRGSLDRAPSRAPHGPALGEVVESGADRGPAAGRLP